MFLPISLLFVGAVLVLNGLWMSGRISDREIVVINFATAAITATVAAVSLVRATTGDEVRSVALTLLFSATMPPAIAQLASSLLKHPTKVEVPMDEANIPKIDQCVHLIESGEKPGGTRNSNPKTCSPPRPGEAMVSFVSSKRKRVRTPALSVALANTAWGWIATPSSPSMAIRRIWPGVKTIWPLASAAPAACT